MKEMPKLFYMVVDGSCDHRMKASGWGVVLLTDPVVCWSGAALAGKSVEAEKIALYNGIRLAPSLWPVFIQSDNLAAVAAVTNPREGDLIDKALYDISCLKPNVTVIKVERGLVEPAHEAAITAMREFRNKLISKKGKRR